MRIGLPLEGWDLAVVGASGCPVGWGETGELVIGGVGMARYLDLVKDSSKFAPLSALNWERAYHSGDLVRAEPDGKNIGYFSFPNLASFGKFCKPRISYGSRILS